MPFYDSHFLFSTDNVGDGIAIICGFLLANSGQSECKLKEFKTTRKERVQRMAL
jgi:hypothetical protein